MTASKTHSDREPKTHLESDSKTHSKSESKMRSESDSKMRSESDSKMHSEHGSKKTSKKASENNALKTPDTGKKRRRRGSAIKAGMSPGAMVFVGEQKLDRARIDIIQYDATELNEMNDVAASRCEDLTQSAGISWINVNGIHDTGLIEVLGKSFRLHPLTQEDILNTSQRLKIEEFPDYIFIVLKMVSYNDLSNQIEIENVSLILGDRYVISFQEKDGDVFDPVRNRIRSAKGRIRSMKSDYLAYAIMDALVDSYFLTVDRIGDRIETLDDQILASPDEHDLAEIHQLKRSIITLRKSIRPLREEIGSIGKSDSNLITPDTRMFWRDLYDHTIQIIDMVETYRDTLGGIHDIYLSGISNRMNEVMKTLTIIATIFIPLTFIVGVYGMNFENMPELKWSFGYFLVWGVMAAVGVGMFFFFRRRKWF